MLNSKRNARGASRIRIGVIGASSHVAQVAVIPAILESHKAELVAMASRNDKKLGFSRGVDIYNNYVDLICAKNVDAVYIPLPNALHAEAVKFALSHQKHVLCEKPLAMSGKEATELTELANSTQRVLMEAYMTHYHPRDQELMKVVSARDAVRVRNIYAGFTGNLERKNDFRWNSEMGGGSLRDVGIYLISPILQAAGGLPHSVYGQASYSSTGVDESFTGLLTFRDGMTATIFSSFVSGEGQYLRVTFEKGRISLTNAFTPTIDDNLFEVSDQTGKMQKFKTKPANSYLEMVNHFCDLINGRATPLRPLSASVMVQRVVDHLLLSATHNRIELLN
ncbi:MAG: Gfo/Idh/MocA family oxidoreductase [Acidimicrobiaceae bacterium]|nr:Gfo/Idh/MocA family oxidoreductase [Acidimicrobiaceae bacterium]